MKAEKGFTLIELAMTMMIVITLAGFAYFSYRDYREGADAVLVDSMQSSLQSIVSQASARTDTNATNLNAAAVVRAVRMDGTTGGSENVELTTTGLAAYQVRIDPSNRTASYIVNPSGNVSLVNITGFTHFNISANGTIQKI